MKKIIFTDKNKKLVKLVEKIFVETINNTHCELITRNKDVLKVKKEFSNAKIITASNPDFLAGGGLDKILAKQYPDQWKNAREFKFEKDLFFVVSVDKNRQATDYWIKRAFFGAYMCSRKHDIIITGIGTGIGGLDIDNFKKYISNFLRAAFSNSNFYNSNFSNSDFSYSNFKKAKFNFKIYPDEGKFIGWKKAQNKIIKLEIQDGKNVIGGFVGRKLRTDKVKVLEIQEINGEKTKEKEIRSDYTDNFVYGVGKIIKEQNFVKNHRLECEKGIHFFVTRQEAVDY